MFLAIPLGYFIAAFLLFTGLVNCKEYIQHVPEGTGYTEVLNGAAQAGWPLIAAVVILLLIQACHQIERLRLVASYAPEPVTDSRKPRKKSQPPAPAAEPAPTATPNLAHLAAAPAPAAAAPQQPLRYPNSPIPGAARTAQERPASVPATRVTKVAPTPQQAEAQGLNFFKVD